MLYTYAECKDKYKTDYELRKVLATGELKKVRRGIYSDEGYEPDLAVISRAYPYAVFTMNSAFYYHGLTDTIPTGLILLIRLWLTRERKSQPSFLQIRVMPL